MSLKKTKNYYPWSKCLTDGKRRQSLHLCLFATSTPAFKTKVQSFRCFFALFSGTLQIWYRLQTDRSPDVFNPTPGNLADGRLHRIRIHRVGKNLYVQVSHRHTEGFSIFLASSHRLKIMMKNYCSGTTLCLLIKKWLVKCNYIWEKFCLQNAKVQVQMNQSDLFFCCT